MLSEDTLKLIQTRRNPVNSLRDLDKRLIGTREGFIFYTTSFRKDFDTKMSMLGRLEQENKKYKEVINKAINNIDLVIELIKQQPTEDDRWILDRLNANKSILKEVE